MIVIIICGKKIIRIGYLIFVSSGRKKSSKIMIVIILDWDW